MVLAMLAGCGATADDGTVCGCKVTGVDGIVTDGDVQLDGEFDPDASVIMVLTNGDMTFNVTCTTGDTAGDCDAFNSDPPVPPGTYDLSFEVSCGDMRLELPTGDEVPDTVMIR